MFDASKPRKHITKNTTPIAAALKAVRNEIGLTQKSFSDFTGVGLKAIRTLEQGGNHVGLDKLQILLDFLGLEVVILPRDQAKTFNASSSDSKQNKEA